VKLILPIGEKGFNLMPYLVSSLLLLVFGFGGYKVVRAVAADYFWRVSLVATSKNDGSGAYNNQIKAIAMNPNLADYRAIYAQTNLALAQNFLNVEQGQDVTEENKQKASTLVQQAVREAQAAVSLDQKISAYWVNLGSIYRALVGVVDGTLDWSVQSYQQAAVVDPANPSVYMELGSMYYGVKDYATAERYFEEAVTNKQNYANAWYNWAYAAKQQNKLQLAVNRLEQALALVPNDSEDYTKAKEEFDKWEKEYNEAVAKYNEQVKQQQEQQKTDNTEQKPVNTEPLTTPEPLPSMGAEEQVNVPAEQLEPQVTP
jgi:tetratricopeptide (TPR) repeat protein